MIKVGLSIKPGWFAMIILLIVAAQALGVLVILGQGQVGVIGGDGAGYHQMAINLLQHKNFSLSPSNPDELTIYRCPGYPTFLALIYLVSGNSTVAVKVVQFALLGLIAYWVYCIALRYSDGRVAKLSALLCVTYPPLVFLSAFHLTEILSTCFTVGIILLLEKQTRSEGQKQFSCLAIGLILGGLSLVRPSLALSIGLIAIAFILNSIATRKSIPFQKSLLHIVLMGVGFLLILSPWLLRNMWLTNRIILSPTGPESLLCSMLQYKGAISYALTLKEWNEVYFPEIYWKGQEEVDKKVGSIQSNITNNGLGIPLNVQKELLLNEYWQRRASEEFEQLTFVQIAKSVPKRLAYLWSTSDMSPPNLWAGALHRAVQGHFVILFMFAVAGIAARWRVLRKEWPLWVFPFYISFVHLFFHIEPRYSIPARPFILIYCAVGIVWLSDLVSKRIRVSRELVRA